MPGIKLNITSNEGYSLPAVLMIMLVVLMILFSLIYLSSIYMLQDVWKLQKTHLDYDCESAANIILSDSSFISIDTFTISSGRNPVLINVNRRGLLYEVVASAYKGQQYSTMKYIIANNKDSMIDCSLIISKPNFRGAVTGNTRIIGNIKTTANRLTQGRIQGLSKAENNYHNGELIVDENMNSSNYDHRQLGLWFSKIDSLKNKSIDYNGNIIADQTFVDTLKTYTMISISGSLTFTDSIILSTEKFSKSIYAAGGFVFEENSFVDGELDLFTDSTIVIRGNCGLKNLTICSLGSCEIKNNTQISFCQLLSKSNISLTGVFCEFPTIICSYVNCDIPDNLNNSIDISSSTINGTIMLLCSTIGLSSNKSVITLKQGSKFQGLLYSENFMNSECNVQGSVYAYELFYYKSPTEYRNWLVNTNIDNKALDKNYLLPFGFHVPINAEIMKKKWIN